MLFIREMMQVEVKNIGDFSNNIIENIIILIPLEDFSNARLVSKKFNQVICNSTNEKIQEFFKNFISNIINHDEKKLQIISNYIKQPSLDKSFIFGCLTALKIDIYLAEFLFNIKVKKIHAYWFQKDTLTPKANFLINTNKVDEIEEFQLAIQKATKYGCFEIVKLLLKNENIKPSVNNNEAILNAVKQGNKSIVKALLKHNNFDFKIKLDLVLEEAIKMNQIEIVVILLKNKKCKFSENCANEALSYAVINDNEKIVKILLQDNRFKYPFVVLSESIKNNRINIVKILLNDKKMVSETLLNQALDLVSENGNVEILKILIEFKRTNLSVFNNIAIHNAIYYGHTEILKILLSDKTKIESYDGYHRDLFLAMNHSETLDMVQLMLENKWLDQTNFEDDNYRILIASMKGQEKIIKKIVQNKFDIHKNYHFCAIRFAIRNGFLNIAKEILKLYKNKEISMAQVIIKDAKKYGCLQEIKLLFDNFEIKSCEYLPT